MANVFECEQSHAKNGKTTRRSARVTEDANGYRLHLMDGHEYSDKRHRTFDAAVSAGIAFCTSTGEEPTR